MSINKKIVHFFDKTFYPKYKDNWDNDMFRDLTLPYLDPKATVLLDLGCGRGGLKQMDFKNQCHLTVGVDPEKAVFENPYIAEGHVGFGDSMPFLEANRFDVVVSNNVLEHVTDPDGVFSEVSRVLKKGGVYITKTPNLYHYMPTIARLTPNSFHIWINKMRGRDAIDTFPTQYKVNTKSAQTHFAEKNGMSVEKLMIIEGRPEYLRMTFFTYIFGIIYEKLVNLLGIDSAKIVIFSVFRKK